MDLLNPNICKYIWTVIRELWKMYPVTRNLRGGKKKCKFNAVYAIFHFDFDLFFSSSCFLSYCFSHYSVGIVTLNGFRCNIYRDTKKKKKK